jgi:PST family polysaccharide transporter
MWEQAKESFHPFMSAALGNLLGGSSVLFLGFFKDMNTVGSYAAIERIARAEVLSMIPVSRAAYPHMSQRFHEGLQAGNRAMVKLCAYVLGATLLFVGAVAIFSRNILRLLYGNRLIEQAHLFSSFSVWAFLSVLNGLLGLHYLIASGHAKQFAKSVFWSAMVTVLLFGLLINPLGGWGALGAVVLGELVQTAIIAFAIVSINRRAKTEFAANPPVEAAG